MAIMSYRFKKTNKNSVTRIVLVVIITETRPQAKTAGLLLKDHNECLPRRCKLKSSHRKEKRVVISGLRPLWPSALENGSFFPGSPTAMQVTALFHDMSDLELTRFHPGLIETVES